MRKKILLTLIFSSLFLFHPDIILGATVHWINKNTICADPILLKRPSDRWRVVNINPQDIIDLKFNRSGKDVVIRIYEVAPTENNLSKKNGKLLSAYEKDGFYFAPFVSKKILSEAHGFNSNNFEEVFISYFWKTKNHDKGIAIEITLKESDVIFFKPQYDFVINSISWNANENCSRPKRRTIYLK